MALYFRSGGGDEAIFLRGMSGKAIVLDTNILIRAVLGKRVRELIFDKVTTVKFSAPDVAYADARKYLPALLKKRGVDSSAAMLVLDRLEGVVQSIDAELYAGESGKSAPFGASSD